MIGAAEAVLQKEDLKLLKEQVEDFGVHDGPGMFNFKKLLLSSVFFFIACFFSVSEVLPLSELQRELILHDKRNLHTSFISELWFDMYLTDRLPCPINYNPFLVYAPDPDPAYNNQVRAIHQ